MGDTRTLLERDSERGERTKGRGRGESTRQIGSAISEKGALVILTLKNYMTYLHYIIISDNALKELPHGNMYVGSKFLYLVCTTSCL